MFFFQEPPILRWHERARCRRQRRARLSALSSSVPGTLGVLSLFFSRCSSSLLGLFYAAAKQITRRDDGTAFDVELERKRAGEGNSDEPNGVADVQEDEDNGSTISSFSTVSPDGEVNLEPGKGPKDKALFDDIVDLQMVRTDSSFVSVGAAGGIFSDLKHQLLKNGKRQDELLNDVELLQVQGEQLQGSAPVLEKLEQLRQTREEENRILQKLKQLYGGRKVSTDNKNKQLVVSLSAPWPQAQAQPLSVRLFSSPEGTAPFVALSVENREALANPLSKVVDQITVNHVLDAANAAHHQGGGQAPKYRVLFTQPGAISTSTGPLAITDTARTPEQRTQYFNALENDSLRWSNQLILLLNIKQIYLEMCRYNFYNLKDEYQEQFGEVEVAGSVGDNELLRDAEAAVRLRGQDRDLVQIFSVDNNDPHFDAAQFTEEIRGDDFRPEAVVREVVIQDITSTSGDGGLDFTSMLNEVRSRVLEVEAQSAQKMTLPANCDRGPLQMTSYTVTCATTGKDSRQHGFRKFQVEFALACDSTARVEEPPPSELQKQLKALKQKGQELQEGEEGLGKQRLDLQTQQERLQQQHYDLLNEQKQQQERQERLGEQQQELQKQPQELQNEEEELGEQRIEFERERKALQEEHRLGLEELLEKRQHLEQEREKLQNDHQRELREEKRGLHSRKEQFRKQRADLQTQQEQLEKQRRKHQEQQQELPQEQQELQRKREELARKHLRQQMGRQVTTVPVETLEESLAASSGDEAFIGNSNKLIEVVLQDGEQENKKQVLKLRKLTLSAENKLPFPFIDWQEEEQEHDIATALDATTLNIQEVSATGTVPFYLEDHQKRLPFYRFLFKQPGAVVVESSGESESVKNFLVNSDEKKAYFTPLDQDPRNWSRQLSLLEDPQIKQIFAEMCRFNYNFEREYAEQFRPFEQGDTLLHVLKNKFNIDNEDEAAGGKQFSQQIRADRALTEQEVREVIVQEHFLLRDDNTPTDFNTMLAEVKDRVAKKGKLPAGISRNTAAEESFRAGPYTIMCATRGEAKWTDFLPFRKIAVHFEFDYDSQVTVRP